jgi:hypothetical protein
MKFSLPHVKNGQLMIGFTLLLIFFEVLKKVSTILNEITFVWQPEQGVSQHFSEVLSK